MGGGVVQAEQRIKLFQAFLCRLASHFLRLVQDDDRTVRFDDIDWSAGAEIIQFCADPSCIFATGIECLDVNNHDVDVCTLAVIIDIRQLFGVIHKWSNNLAIIRLEVLPHGFEALLNALTNRNTRNNDNELTPAIQFI